LIWAHELKPFTKTANEGITLEFEFARVLEYLWLPGQEYSVGDYVRPTVPNGFNYECTNAGQSDNEEPDWSTTLTSPRTTLTDGSVVWAVTDFGTSSTDTISTKSVTADTGLSATAAAQDGTKITSRITGGTAGNSYDVVCKIVTAAGDTYEATRIVTVK
jgi:hypothetical protein